MSSYACEGGQKIRISCLYKVLGVPTPPGAGVVATVTKPNGTAFAGSPFAATDDGAGLVHVDITMPTSDYGIWWVRFGPGATVFGVDEDWFTLSPPNG